MDLPPPPPPPLFRHHHNLLRYENVLRPPEFLPPPPYRHHLPPPPPPPPLPLQPHSDQLSIHLPPPPPPPPPSENHPMSSLPRPSRFALSPQRYPVIDRSHRYEFDPPPKPYFHHTFLPPPPPLPPREDIPLQFVHDYTRRNPIVEDDISLRGHIDNTRELPGNWDRNSRWGPTEVHNRVLDIDVGGRDRYRDVISESAELYKKRVDDRSWDRELRDWGRDLDRSRDYDERRWDSVMDDRNRDFNERRWTSGMDERSHDLFREPDFNELGWKSGMNEMDPDLYRKGNFDDRRWHSGIYNQGYKLHCQVDDDERRWDSNRSAGVLSRLGNRRPEFSEDDPRLGSVLSRLGHRQPDFAEVVLSPSGVLSRLGNRQPEFSEDDPRLGSVSSRLGHRQPDFAEDVLSYGGVLSRLGNRQPEFGEGDMTLGRFSGRLGAGARNGEFNRPDKKKRLQKKSTLHRIQSGKVRSRHSGGLKPQHFAEDSSSGSYKGNEKGSRKMQSKVEGEREHTPVELAISFKSNALVAKAIQVPSQAAVESCVKSKSSRKRLWRNVSASKNDVVSDLRSDSLGTLTGQQDRDAVSGSGNVTANNARDFGETCSTWSSKRKRDTEQLSLEANLGMEKDYHDVGVGICKPFVPKIKKKKSSLNTTPGSPFVSDNAITSCTGRAQGFATVSEDTDCAHQLRADHAHESFLAYGNNGYEDTLGSNQHVYNVNKCVHDRVDDVSKLSVSGDKVLKCSLAESPSEDMVHIKDHDTGGSSRPQETRIPEVNYFSEIHELVSFLKSDCAIIQRTEDTIVSDVKSKDANSEDLSLKRDSKPPLTLDANNFKSSEGPAVAECTNVPFDVSISSCFLSVNGEGMPRFDLPFPDKETDFSYNTNSVGRSPEVTSDKGTSLSVDNSSLKVISDKGPCLTIDNSSKVLRKRKDRGDHVGVSGRKRDADVGIVRSIDGEVIRDLANEGVPAMDGNINSKKDNSGEDISLKGPSVCEDSLQEFHINPDVSFPGYQKKQKLFSPRSSLSSLSEDDTTGDGLSVHSSVQSECGAEQSEDTSLASRTINQYRAADGEGEVGASEVYLINLLDDHKSHGDDDLALIASGISCSDRNALSASNSGDEQLASGFDMQSCITSLEELNDYSELSLSDNTKASACLSDDEMILRSDNISNKKSLIADPNTNGIEKYFEAVLEKSQTNANIPLSLHKDTSRAVKTLYPVHGKKTWSKNPHPSAVTKVFPTQHPVHFSNARKLYSSHVTKSRTWCRTGNSPLPKAEPKLQPPPAQNNGTNTVASVQGSYVRKGNSLVRKPSLSDDTSPGFHGLSSSVYRLSPCTNAMKNNMESDDKTGDADAPALKRTGKVSTHEMTKALSTSHSGNSLSCTPCNFEEPLSVRNPENNGCLSKALDVMKEKIKSSQVPESQIDSVASSDSQSTVGEGNSEKKIVYVKRRSYQLVAASNSIDTSVSKVDNNQSELSDGYYKRRENQLVRASPENTVKGNAKANVSMLVPQSIISRTSARRQSGFSKTSRHSKFSFVWKLHDTNSSEKYKNSLGPRKVWPYLFSHKRAAYWKSLLLGIKPSISNISQKLLVSRKRGAIYTRSRHGYSLKMSKVLSVGGSSLKWSKSIERNSKKANEEATRAVAAAEKRKKEEKSAVPIASKTRNHVPRKWVLNVKLRPGERIFRIGSERYKMDATRRTLHRITEKESPSSVALQSEKNVKRSYIPRRLLIGNDEYVRIGNGNQLVRDPKKRTRVLASEKVRWSLRTARLRLARKRKYCQFFTRFGKCNKDDGKCPYIHDPSKIVVCTKFLTGSCTNINCKLTHKVIPERMQDCSYFLKGSCSNDNCPYRHVHVDPDSPVCESFLRGHCADGNECRKKHTYVCPDFEATGVCPHASTCKLHHPKKKADKKPENEQRIVRGRYFDGGLLEVAECSSAAPTEKLYSEGKDDIVVHEGTFPDYISLDVNDDEPDQTLVSEKVSDENLPGAWTDDLGEVR